MKQPKVAIILVNYNSWEETRACLQSLQKINYQSIEIILVDNNSNQTIKFDEFKVEQIFNKQNLGFAGGSNLGIKKALKNGADYVLLLNNDTVVKPDFLGKLIKAGETDKRVGILGSKIYRFNSEEVCFNGGQINWLKTKGVHWERENQTETKEVDYLTGACLLIKREVIKKIGLMNEDYFLYFEDVDWCLKARKVSYKCLLIGASQIYHKVSASTKAGSFSYIYYHTRNGLLLAKNNASFFVKILAYSYSLLRLIWQECKIILKIRDSKWPKAIKLGILDFYKNKFGKLNI